MNCTHQKVTHSHRGLPKFNVNLLQWPFSEHTYVYGHVHTKEAKSVTWDEQIITHF
jgi:hypothetical protein